LVVVENMLSLPLNVCAARALESSLRGRLVIVHHHDLPWQLDMPSPSSWPPNDFAWSHVCINELTRRDLVGRGISTTLIYNRFARQRPICTRRELRSALGISEDAILLLQPTRILERKNIAASVAAAEELDATLWITGPPEPSYSREFDRLSSRARCRILRGLPPQMSIADAYEASDAVTFPSLWEGFGNPLIEAALYRRPVLVGDYPVLRELRHFGFHWLSITEPRGLLTWLAGQTNELLDRNARIAGEHFGLDTLPSAIYAALCRPAAKWVG
jgi:glycosyltransferase involved in cell wall biosynthesis